jgi:ribosomal protein L37AE/L43A
MTKETKDTCNHEKIYSVSSNFWRCAKCGQTGHDKKSKKYDQSYIDALKNFGCSEEGEK